MIVVEVLSPGTPATDTGGKLADYVQVPSVVHYLIVHPTQRTIIHHRRAAAGMDTRILTGGEIAMDPPGLVVTMQEIYDIRRQVFSRRYSFFRKWPKVYSARSTLRMYLARSILLSSLSYAAKHLSTNGMYS